MIKKVYFPASVIITAYGSVLLLIAFFFLMRDSSLHKLQSALPLPFIFRFCTFWFISIVLAIVLYLASLNNSSFMVTTIDKVKASHLGVAVFAMAVLFATLAAAAVFFFKL